MLLKTSSPQQRDLIAGQAPWTRAVARDLFPVNVSPFHWTLLQRPAEKAMQRAWADLGARVSADNFWRRAADGYVYLNADLLVEAGRALHGAAWLGTRPPVQHAGFFSRWQAQGTIQRAHAQITATAKEIELLNGRLADWLTWVRGLRWTQADLLQVMEELEPRAQAVLRGDFILRAGLSAAQDEVAERLAAWRPDCPAAVISHLYAGLAGLPSVEAAYALQEVGHATHRAAAEASFRTRYGHRGPGETGPDARRWHDHPGLAHAIAALPARRDAASAQAQRQAAATWLETRLSENQRCQLEPILARARALCRAVDLARDGLAHVMAAAQVWLRAAAGEAVSAGLIGEPSAGRYLELEELKQVATGEWHRGHSEQVRAAVIQRQARVLSDTAEHPQPAQAASPGQARGPILRQAWLEDATLLPGAILLAEVADPGCAVGWLSAGALVDAAGDPWSPGMIVARALGIPAITGQPAIGAEMRSGQLLAVDGDLGRVELL